MNDMRNGPILRTDFQTLDDTFTLARSAVINNGVIPSARLVQATNPTANDTLTIGGKVFKIVAALGAADTFVQVKRAGSNAATLASLVKAINGTVAAAEWTEATTAFAVAVVADAVSTTLRIRQALTRGGSPVAGASSSIALAASMTAGGNVWDRDNLNETGESPAKKAYARGKFTVTATQITATQITIELPFTPRLLAFYARSSTGVQRAFSDAVTISSNAIVITLGGGASPNLQAGDIVNFEAME